MREIQLNDPEIWSKICLREKDGVDADEEDDGCGDERNEQECPFEDDVDDDSAISVPELVANMAALRNGTSVDKNIHHASEGHLELVEDSPEFRDIQKMTMDEIIAEVEASADYGRGKRHRHQSRRYEGQWEAH